MSFPRLILPAILVSILALGCNQDPQHSSNLLAPGLESAANALGPVLLHTYDGDALDSSGNGLHGFIHGSPKFESGCLNYGLGFDGNDDWVRVPYDSLLEPEVVSVEVYFRPKRTLQDHVGFVPLVVKMPSWGDFWNRVDGYDLWYQDSTGDTGRIGFGIGANDGTLRPNASWVGRITPNRYYHVVGTYDGVALRLYLDGDLVAMWLHNEPIAYLGGRLNIGGNIYHSYYGGTHWYDGVIDEVAIYPYVLTPGEISQRANRCSLSEWIPDDDNLGDEPDRRVEPGR